MTASEQMAAKDQYIPELLRNELSKCISMYTMYWESIDLCLKSPYKPF